MTTVYVLIIDHKHGRDVSVHETDVDANIQVEHFARDWWSTDGPDEPMPEDNPGDLISRYFDASGESWDVEECDFPPISH
jgi:hypothetical protein